jgi:methionine-S-sulfoxide reductase
MNKAYFAAGCFWGIEEFYRQQDGVVNTSVGYGAGRTPNATYDEVCSGITGHAEICEVEFDEDIVSFEELTHFFFQIHNPTTLNQQGLDIGSQYRSGIYFLNEEQEKSASKIMDFFQKTSEREIVTEIEAFTNYYKAEEVHQQYINKQGGNAACAIQFNKE